MKTTLTADEVRALCDAARLHVIVIPGEDSWYFAVRDYIELSPGKYDGHIGASIHKTLDGAANEAWTEYLRKVNQ